MNNSILGVISMVVVLIANVTLGGISNDVQIAKDLYNNKQYEGALNAFKRVTEVYANEDVNLLANAQRYIGSSLRELGKHKESYIEFEKVLKLYPKAHHDILAMSHRYMGYALQSQGKFDEAVLAYKAAASNYANANPYISLYTKTLAGLLLLDHQKYTEAQSLFETIIVDNPNSSDVLISNINKYLGSTLMRQGKKEEAQLAYMQAAIGYGFFNLKFQQDMFNLINPVFATKEAYQKYLQKLLMIVPATAENAEFLGKVKSQLNVLQ